MSRRCARSLAPVIVALSGFLASGRATAGSIPIFNTGVDATGTPLPGSSTDPHWTILSGPGLSVPQAAVVIASPPGSYTESPNSAWVWVNASGDAGTGTPYTFAETFDLTGFNPATATLSGEWAVDNELQIELDGATPTGTGLDSSGDSNFLGFTPFTITGGFVSGINTLDILATDTGNPGALNLTNLILTATPAAAPEPASMALLGLGGVALVGRRALARRARRAS